MALLAQTSAAAGGSGTGTWIGIAVAVVVVIIVAAIWMRRRQQLRERFGPEYDRAVAQTGSTIRGEMELTARERRHRALDIHPLSPEARERYAAEWQRVQARFVDQPGASVGEADRLIANVMRDRGYPTGDADRQIADLSVEHAKVVERYRYARSIAQKNERGEASTEELRNAVVAYRELFGELLGAGAATASKR